jgi:chemotaxis protein CheC
MPKKHSALALDALGEVSNIGSGHAATALSKLVGRTVDLTVPDTRVVPLAEATSLLGNDEDEVVAVLTPVTGGMEAQVLLVIDLHSAASLCGLLGVEPMSEMGMSALCEIGNILTSSYIGAISQLTGMLLEPAPPMAAINMLGALVDTTLAMAATDSDDVLILRTEISIEGDTAGTHFTFVTTGGLTALLARLGVE